MSKEKDIESLTINKIGNIFRKESRLSKQSDSKIFGYKLFEEGFSY